MIIDYKELKTVICNGNDKWKKFAYNNSFDWLFKKKYAIFKGNARFTQRIILAYLFPVLIFSFGFTNADLTCLIWPKITQLIKGKKYA